MVAIKILTARQKISTGVLIRQNFDSKNFLTSKQSTHGQSLDKNFECVLAPLDSVCIVGIEEGTNIASA